jgi:2-isopropylmalate synthase
VAAALQNRWKLEEVHYAKLGAATSSAHVVVRDLATNEIHKREATGDGSVDAVVKAIGVITSMPGELVTYTVSALTEGEDAMGQCSVKVKFPEGSAHAKAADADVVVASGKAYVAAINKMLQRQPALPAERP